MTVPQHIMYEEFDDETVVVNMERGHYYALSGLSAQLWSQLTNGGAEPEPLAESLATDATAVEQALRLFAQEGLLNGGEAFDGIKEPNQVLENTPFAATFERFTDVEELLLADPIHDFDASGWSKTSSE